MTEEQLMTLKAIDGPEIAKVISETLVKMAQAKKDKATIKSMIEEKLDRIPDYVQKADAVKKARQEANVRKAQILSDQDGKNLLDEMDDANDSLKGLKQEMAAQLEIYWEKTRENEVTLASGTKLRIKKRFEVASEQLKLL